MLAFGINKFCSYIQINQGDYVRGLAPNQRVAIQKLQIRLVDPGIFRAVVVPDQGDRRGGHPTDGVLRA
jgi:hypothetical protein